MYQFRYLVLFARRAVTLSSLEWVVQASNLLQDWLLLSLDTRFFKSPSQGNVSRVSDRL